MKRSSFKTYWDTVFLVFARAKLSKIFSCSWYHVSKKLKLNTTHVLFRLNMLQFDK